MDFLQQDNQSNLKEIMVGNLEKLVLNNRYRIRELQRYGTHGLRTAFKLVPILLQINHSEIPGYIHHEETPRGVFGFEYSNLAKQILQLFPHLRGERAKAVNTDTPIVESLMLMGSAGSVGQSSHSDLDYWVCLDEQRLSQSHLHLFRKKLDTITNWCMRSLKTEVNFYTVDLADLAANRLQTHGEETEGEVAPLMVKEEFYRTLLMVMGKYPLWWATPLGAGQARYWDILELMDKYPGSLISSNQIIDLGFPEKPEPQEYMSAALWLSRKSEADPFKGILKMVLILEQVESKLNAPLLCDEIKEKAILGERDDLPVDPYITTIRRVLRFSQDRLGPSKLELIRNSAYFKIRGPIGYSRTGRDTPKALFIQELIKDWGWDQSQVDWLDDYANWSERERLALGQQLKELLYDMYTNIAKRLMTEYPGQVDTREKGLTQFKARIMARYSDHGAKVEDLPSSLHRRTIPNVLTLLNSDNRWIIYGGKIEAWNEGSEYSDRVTVYECERAARAAAWLVYNRLYTPALKLRLRPRPGPVSTESMMQLLETLSRLFPPVDYEKLKSKGRWQLGGQGPRLLVVNLEEPISESKIIGTDLIYRTGWGEMRHTSLAMRSAPNEAAKFLGMTQQLSESGEFDFEDLTIFAPPGGAGRKIKNNLTIALRQALIDKSLTLPSTNGSEKSQLDLD